MHWGLGGLILVSVAIVVRRVLKMNEPQGRVTRPLRRLSENREVIYQAVVLQLETRAGMLGVSLNDAIEEHNSGNREIAWRLVRLAASEWDRLAEEATLLLNALSEHLPTVHVAYPIRGMVSQRFKSRSMIDYARMHELLDQFVFRSKLRSQLHVRVLRRAVDTLTSDFRRTYRQAERLQDFSSRPWDQIDLGFHDFDLISKEAMLAFRTLLTYLPDASLASLIADLQPLLERGTRTVSVIEKANHR